MRDIEIARAVAAIEHDRIENPGAWTRRTRSPGALRSALVWALLPLLPALTPWFTYDRADAYAGVSVLAFGILQWWCPSPVREYWRRRL